MSDIFAADTTSSAQPALETVRCTLADIGDSQLNSFVQVDSKGALATATNCDIVARRGGTLGPLHGMPVAVKDLIDVAGLRSTMGSEQYSDNVAKRDAAVVSRLRAAGAIIIGKANTHEFAYGSSGDNSFAGAVCNPRNPGHMSGGSSSGSAAAVGAGLCKAALGTDTSASIRLPAALCGVVGMKPTYDLLPRDGVFPLSGTLDHVGPITRRVSENARILEVLAANGLAYGHKLCKAICGLVVGIPENFYGEYLSVEVRQALANAKQLLADAGAKILRTEVRDIDAIYAAQQLVLKTEAYANHRAALDSNQPYSDEVRARLMAGSDVCAHDYLTALATRPNAIAAFDEALDEVDVILTPTCGITAPPIGERTTTVEGTPHSTFWLLTRLTAPTNFTGHPSLSVPYGEANGLPIGMQLIGRYHDESTLYQVAQALEEGQKLAGMSV